jgi:plasmid stabilization system protein ParE
LADYLITWVDYALEQYLGLDQHVSTQLNQQLRLLAQHPKSNAHYDPDTDRWTAEFDAGHGLVVYIVNDEHRRVVILRILHLG